MDHLLIALATAFIKNTRELTEFDGDTHPLLIPSFKKIPLPSRQPKSANHQVVGGSRLDGDQHMKYAHIHHELALDPRPIEAVEPWNISIAVHE